jgi:hypothetical protein
MYSAYRTALNKLQVVPSARSASSSNQQRVLSWKEAFQSTIQQLSLAEASQDAQEKGMVLSCREKERKQITEFLKTAISGLVKSKENTEGEEEGTMTLKSSMFIAGPPGTGKASKMSPCNVSQIDYFALNSIYCSHITSDRNGQVNNSRTSTKAA